MICDTIFSRNFIAFVFYQISRTFSTDFATFSLIEHIDDGTNSSEIFWRLTQPPSFAIHFRLNCGAAKIGIHTPSSCKRRRQTQRHPFPPTQNAADR